MTTRTHYRYLERRPDKRTQELFIKGTGVRTSTIWHDRYVSRLRPEQIAKDRDMPVEAIYEALAYCQENWEIICQEKDEEHRFLEQSRFFTDPRA